MYELARMYREGDGVEKSSELAEQWKSRAAKTGHQPDNPLLLDRLVPLPATEPAAGRAGVRPPTTATKADQLSPKELIALAPRFSSDDPSMHSFHVRGVTKTGISRLGWEVWWERPNRYAVELTDTSDNTPLLLAVNGHLMSYDAPGRRVVLNDSVTIKFIIRINHNEGQFDFGITRNPDMSGRSLIDVDVRSIVDALSDVRSARIADGTCVMTGALHDGRRVNIDVDRAKKWPYARIEVSGEGLIIDITHGDEAMPQGAWAFPSREALERQLKIVSNSDLPSGERAGLIAGVLSLGYRAAFSNPDGRPAWEEKFGAVDWERAKAEDGEVSSALHRIVRQARQDSGR